MVLHDLYYVVYVCLGFVVSCLYRLNLVHFLFKEAKDPLFLCNIKALKLAYNVSKKRSYLAKILCSHAL